MNDHQQLDDVALYALGTLPAAQARDVRHHIATCDRCAHEYRALTALPLALATDAAQAPSDLLKARIMREVRNDVRQTPARASTLPAYIAAAACLIVALGLGAINLSLVTQLHHANDRVASLSNGDRESTQQLASADAMLADLTSADAKRYPVRNGEIVRSGNHVYLAMHDMPRLAPGKVFQAWVLPKGAKAVKPLPTFVADAHGAALVLLPIDARETAAVAVSVEPTGGSRAPTSKPIVVQALD